MRPPDHVLTEAEAEKLLEPYKRILAECVRHGWDVWKKEYEGKHHRYGARTRAAIVWDEIVGFAEQRFSNMPGVIPKRTPNSFLLYIGEDIVIRFKKINKNGKCRFILTRQQRLFNLQREFPGMEEGTMLCAGYALDDVQQGIERILIVCQFGNQILYAFDVTQEQDSGTAPITMPTPTAPPPSGAPQWVQKSDQKSKKQKPKKVKAKAVGKE